MIVTTIQQRVLASMDTDKALRHPRGSLERLQKKGLVKGNRKQGWVLTLRGRTYLNQNVGTPLQRKFRKGPPALA